MTYDEFVKTPGIRALRDLAEEMHTPIIRRDTQDYLAKLIKRIKPARILEIGTAIGYSAIFFASLAPKARVYSIEKDEYAMAVARHNIRLMGLENHIELLLGDGEEQIEKLADKGEEPFDLIFIDGGKSHYRRFMDAAVKVSHPGTHILSDDISQRSLVELSEEELPRKHRTAARNMKAYLEFLILCPYLQTEFLEIGDGLAVSVYRDGSKQ